MNAAKEIIQSEWKLYFQNDKKFYKNMKSSKHRRYMIWLYLRCFRTCQYWKANLKKYRHSHIRRVIAYYIFLHYNKKMNLLSEKTNVEINIDSHIGRNCDIWHGGVVLNGDIGDNCIFHGMNVVGNKGNKGHRCTPKIGDNVDVGAGAIIIGNVSVADNCIIGAGAVVVKSCEKRDSILIGVPAKENVQ